MRGGCGKQRARRVTRRTTWNQERRQCPESYRDCGAGKTKGIITYGIAANRQNVFAGAAHDAIFNTFRRTKSQIFYWLPSLMAGYYLMHWATERNEYLNSKAGRAEFADVEE
ncbi:Cytochrome b-c1 complex subunit 8 [Beauveria bassiana]|nr:Cytochrome b-c1 complex subunit 8 [Beauveria bassiana]